MPRLRVMTDSTCDLPADWVTQHDIRIVPTYVQFGTESLADDGVQITREGFYQRLISSPVHPTTAAPPAGQTLEIMRQALQDAEHVIGITAPAVLSGIYNTFRLAAEQLGPQRVTLIDSGQLSMGMGWQVLTAAEMAASGASPADIENALRDMQPRVDVWAALDTMQYLRRSGRVSWATAMVGDLFQIKPIINLHDSVVSSVTRTRTSRRSFSTLVELAHKAAPLARLAVMHTQYPDGAYELVNALRDLHSKDAIIVVEATPVLGVHLGPQGLGLGVVRHSLNTQTG